MDHNRANLGLKPSTVLADPGTTKGGNSDGKDPAWVGTVLHMMSKLSIAMWTNNKSSSHNTLTKSVPSPLSDHTTEQIFEQLLMSNIKDKISNRLKKNLSLRYKVLCPGTLLNKEILALIWFYSQSNTALRLLSKQGSMTKTSSTSFHMC